MYDLSQRPGRGTGDPEERGSEGDVEFCERASQRDSGLWNATWTCPQDLLAQHTSRMCPPDPRCLGVSIFLLFMHSQSIIHFSIRYQVDKTLAV